MTPAGIEPATFRFVAQHLNHYRGPHITTYVYHSEIPLYDKSNEQKQPPV